MDFSIDGGIGVFQIDDGKANAVSHSLIDFMMNGLDQAEANAAAVVLLGRPGVFSAGFDLKEIAKGPEEGARLVNRGCAFAAPVVWLPNAGRSWLYRPRDRCWRIFIVSQ